MRACVCMCVCARICVYFSPVIDDRLLINVVSATERCTVLTREFRISSAKRETGGDRSLSLRAQTEFSLVLFFPPCTFHPMVSCPEDNSRRRRDKVVRLGNPVKLQTCTERRHRLFFFFFFVFNKISSRAHARARIGSLFLSVCLFLSFALYLRRTNATLRYFLSLQ